MLLIISILMLLSLYLSIWNYSFVLAAHLSTMGKDHDLVVEMAMIRRTNLKWKKTAARRIRWARLPHVGGSDRNSNHNFWSLRWSFWCFFIRIVFSPWIETGRKLPITPRSTQYPALRVSRFAFTVTINRRPNSSTLITIRQQHHPIHSYQKVNTQDFLDPVEQTHYTISITFLPILGKTHLQTIYLQHDWLIDFTG